MARGNPFGIPDLKLTLFFLDLPMAPANSAINPETRSPYDEEMFSKPKAQFVTVSRQDALLAQVLHQASPQQLGLLAQGAMARLSPVKRGKQGITHIGFFDQGVLTGGVLLLSTILGVTGLCSYYGFGLVRGRLLQGL